MSQDWSAQSAKLPLPNTQAYLQRASYSSISIVSRFKSVIFGLLLLLLWQIAAQLNWIDTLIIPAPTTLVHTFWFLLKSGMLIQDIVASVVRVLVGFFLGALVGISLGAFLGGSQKISETVTPVIEFIRPIPPIAWIPLAILWFGIGNAPAYFIVFIGAVFPIFVNTFAGIRNVDPSHINAAQSLGASRWLLVSRVLLPSALPTIITGLRVGLGIAWACVVAAELIAAQSGLGYLIEWYRQLLRTDIVMVGMITIGVVGLFMNYLMRLLERLIVPWQHGNQSN